MIKLLICQLDGILNDGYSIFGKDGIVYKSFNFLDANIFKKLNFKIHFVNDFISDPDLSFIKNIKSKIYLPECLENNFTKDETACLGCSGLMADIMLNCACWNACPLDSDQDILNLVGSQDDGIILKSEKGHGCLTEFVSSIISYNQGLEI